MAALPDDPAAFLRRLHARRAHLPAAGTTVYRAAHLTETGGVFALDVAGDAGVLSLYRTLAPDREAALAAAAGEALGLAGVYLKRRPPEARHVANTARDLLSPPDPVWGEARAEVTALEDGVPFLLRPGPDLSIGLFTDMRPARAWLRADPGGRVLNTFAYTCGFGLVARLGGAEVVKNLDASRKVLAWGRENYALSGLPAPEEDFVSGDVFDWLGRFAKRGAAFDRVVLDPPSFSKGRSGVWRAERDYAALAALAARLVAPGGALLAATNHAGLTDEAFRKLVASGLDGRGARLETRLGAGEDYPGATHLKVQVWRLG